MVVNIIYKAQLGSVAHIFKTAQFIVLNNTMAHSTCSFTKYKHLKSKTSEDLKYDDVIRKLNTLQTNNSVLEEAKNRILKGNKRSNSLELMQKYLERLGIDIDGLGKRVIHITGTKGKGSTAMLTESLLRSVPYRTGLFVSPHVKSVRERISINGVPLSKQCFVKYFWEIYDILYQQKENELDMPPYFKFLALMAFKAFLTENVDVAVIEVGIGGEFDSTNVFKNTPIVGISSVGLDHTAILGDTVEQIAWDKGGILKHGCRAFTIPNQKDSVLKILQDRASEKGCQLEIVPVLTDYSCNTSEFSYPQKLNASLALQLAKSWDYWNNNGKHLNYDKHLLSKREEQAILDCQIPGRFQIIHCEHTSTTFHLDGAHTVESIMVAKEWFLASCPPESIRILIFNVTGKRNVQSLLEILQNCQFSEAIFCSNQISDKSEDFCLDILHFQNNEEELLSNARENLNIWLQLTSGNGNAVLTVREALSLAQSSSQKPKSVLITGSLHLVGSALLLLEN